MASLLSAIKLTNGIEFSDAVLWGKPDSVNSTVELYSVRF